MAVRGRTLVVLAIALMMAAMIPATALAQLPSTTDPRVGLDPGYPVAETASMNAELLANVPRAPGFNAPPGNFGNVNSDLALQDNLAFVGNFNGFQIYDIGDPEAPSLVSATVCPATSGQGDVSVWGNLLFHSVENGGRTDCTLNPASPLMRGLRIFDISNPAAPQQIATVQTCRGSHTHTLVPDMDDPDNLYVYISGTAGVRSDRPECSNTPPTDPNTSLWRIEVIKVPLNAPQTASIVNAPRLFAANGQINGLQNAPQTPQHPSGINWSPVPITDACHDITAYPEIGLAAGACEGNGILVDITDPANPVRVAEVADPNFAYWHSATFNNDGTKVVFTDEWGGGTQPRCRVTDRLEWGANGIYDIVGGEMEFASYFKMPAAQTPQENCVAHNGSLVPIPGRDVMTQAWYQGGLSVWDFTDSENPTEIAFFDRGPNNGATLALGGLWSTYWYNGEIIGSEIARGLDVFGLLPSPSTTANELAAADTVQLDVFNAQTQPRITWPATFALSNAYLDQAVRAGMAAKDAAKLRADLDKAERFADGPQRRAAIALLESRANQLRNNASFDTLADSLDDLAQSLR